MCGTATSSRSASSMTAPLIQSSSSGLPASRSCSVDVLWSPTAMPASSLRSIEPGSDRGRFLQHGPQQPLHLRQGAELPQRRPGQGGHRVERDVPDQLEPDLVTQTLLDRALESAGDEGLGDAPAPVAEASVRLADREARSLGMADDSRFHDLARAVDDATDDSLGRDRARDHPAGIYALDDRALERAGMRLEVPPRDPVLSRDDHRLRPQ